MFNGGVWQNARTVRGFTCLLQDGVQIHVELVLVASTQGHTYQSMLLSKLLIGTLCDLLCQHCNVPSSLETATM